ncbi:heavy metal sensor histidine kinase [Stutzerimonas kirkiae]|uniref:Sensor protein n=1 Tax=Stutzerimonas kirkiae TaxID=2211392 RepID=A0A4Q9RBR1_9GAMM|nr:heavy metal sensor histidine kinase [Stutzerimonas kirkiae]TBU97270.1 two-component sensor histidine kinase [Stutzerimonas kirkiae]TBV03693.1 two-component sensor histidine kinase [Stutzerimonas kirkiae]TBV11313.1 two-component sensor histidine kinase [Stutzerimonas kirkiae]
MARLSLTTRMSLMFMLAVTVVLALAGLSFNALSQHHFRALDQQVLEEKLASIGNVIRLSDSLAEPERIRLQLQALLQSHQDLSALLLAADGTLFFGNPQDTLAPRHLRPLAAWRMWEWQAGGHLYRGMRADIALPGQDAPLQALLALDITNHTHFFEILQRWFWLGLIASAGLSALLGWIVARRGLAPLRQVTRVTASISAKSLQERIPLEAVPAELKQLVESFNAMLARLEDAFARLSNFSADIAHELRTPLSNLTTHTEVVLSRARSLDDYRENLYSNLEELTRMSRIIDDMLFLAKADNGLIVPQRERTQLAEVLDKLFDYYQLLADERGIRLCQRGAGEVAGDRLMLERALSNLLDNALRHTPANREISVDIRQSAGQVSLCVENPGAAIPAGHLERLFDRFYRIDPARREGSPGNAGLGLAITRSIIEAHGGRIRCTSTDRATAFHIELPR